MQQTSEGIYMLDENWIHKMKLWADDLIGNFNNKIVQAFEWYSLSHKWKDIVWSALREKNIILKSDNQWAIEWNSWIHHLVVNCEWWILEQFQLQAALSEVLGGKWETDDEIQKLCGIFASMGVKIKHENI